VIYLREHVQSFQETVSFLTVVADENNGLATNRLLSSISLLFSRIFLTGQNPVIKKIIWWLQRGAIRYKGVFFFKFGVEVGVGESIENAPLDLNS
jgi:hypothetical protein